ncbi:hypothetical protein JZ751_010654, partial [Albula glossodonta]
NRLFSRSVVIGQILFVPDIGLDDSDPKPPPVQEPKPQESSPLLREVKPLHKTFSPLSDDEEPSSIQFLKMSCRYFTDGMGVVGGVMIVTPNNIMFDPHKSDPLVIEHGCEEYGLICPMEEVMSIALYPDISRMEIKDALPSPGTWGVLPSEHELNPFSRFQTTELDHRPIILDHINTIVTETGDPNANDKSSPDEGFTELELEPNMGDPLPGSPEPCTPSQKPSDSPHTDTTAPQREEEKDSPRAAPFTEESKPLSVTASPDNLTGRENAGIHEIETMLAACTTDQCTEQPTDMNADQPTDMDTDQSTDTHTDQSTDTPTGGIGQLLNGDADLQSDGVAVEMEVAEDQSRKVRVCEPPGDCGKCSPLRPDLAGEVVNGEATTPAPMTEEEEQQRSDDEEEERRRRSEEEMKEWLMKRIQGPIEDMLHTKEDKSQAPPMFLCFKVGKPMRKSFATGQKRSPAHQFGRRGKQPEYWFAVPQERVDHLYEFFVQWSPDVYGKECREAGFVVVEKEELDMIDNFFSDPTPKGWEIITVKEAKRRQSVGSLEDREPLELLPELSDPSLLLQDNHIERVFGAFSTHPFRVSEHCYGTGETFLFSFSPEFKARHPDLASHCSLISVIGRFSASCFPQAFRWSGENSYFVKGNTDSLQLGGGGGNVGLWLDADLYHGSSSSCSTFHNQPLSAERDFTVQGLEVWAFQ